MIHDSMVMSGPFLLEEFYHNWQLCELSAALCECSYVCFGYNIGLLVSPLLSFKYEELLQVSLNYLTELTNTIAPYYFWAAVVFPLGY